MFAGQLLSALKMVICGRLTIHPSPPGPLSHKGRGGGLDPFWWTMDLSNGSSLRIAWDWRTKNWRFLVKMELKVGLQNTVLKGVRSSAHKGCA